MKGINNQNILEEGTSYEVNGPQLMIQSSEMYKENYQVKMIRENHIRGLLKVTVCHKDSCGQYLYDIGGLISLKAKYEKLLCQKEEIQSFLKQFIYLIDILDNYMLERNCIILDPDFIFYKDEEYFFCYYPNLNKTMEESFHELSEYWIKTIDYEDYGSVAFACGIHKKTMEKYYDLENLVRSYTEYEEEPEISMVQDARKWGAMEERQLLQEEEMLFKNSWEVAYEEGEVEEKSSKVGNLLRETSIGKYLEQRKKERWGDWDDLLTQEESFIMSRRND